MEVGIVCGLVCAFGAVLLFHAHLIEQGMEKLHQEIAEHVAECAGEHDERRSDESEQ